MTATTYPVLHEATFDCCIYVHVLTGPADSDYLDVQIEPDDFLENDDWYTAGGIKDILAGKVPAELMPEILAEFKEQAITFEQSVYEYEQRVAADRWEDPRIDDYIHGGVYA